MRVLLLGGTRFIGPAVVRALAADGHEVACFHRGRTSSELPPGVAHIHGDRERLAEHAADLAAFAPEVTIDMLLMTEADARGLATWARERCPRLVAVSSCDVYRAYGVLHRHAEDGEPDPRPADEDGPLRLSRYPYRGMEGLPEERRRKLQDYDKILVEDALRADAGLALTVVRLPMVYGPGDPQRRLSGYLRRMERLPAGLLLPASLARWRACRGYVDDVGRAIALAATHPAALGRTYAVAEPAAPSEEEWLAEVAAAAGWTGRVHVVPDDELPESLRPDFDARQPLVVSSARIRAELGYAEQLPRAEAVARTVAWERPRLAEPSPTELEDLAREAEALERLGRA
ncbi:MAG: NAD-dependent epimerase/dehydratase family protein [Planctomycetota bacterium]